MPVDFNLSSFFLRSQAPTFTDQLRNLLQIGRVVDRDLLLLINRGMLAELLLLLLVDRDMLVLSKKVLAGLLLLLLLLRMDRVLRMRVVIIDGLV